MRGGNVNDSDSREDLHPITGLTTPHPALSPLRGEGALITRSFHVSENGIGPDWLPIFALLDCTDAAATIRARGV